ncbi:MAG: tetratricopeptide repeat protein [Candidatus Acidiferrales bacterium]
MPARLLLALSLLACSPPIAAQPGRPLDTFAALRAALEKNPADIRARLSLARLYSHAGSYAQAVAELEEALRHSPAHLEASLQLAGLLLEQEAEARAVAVLEAARAAHPESAAVLFALGEAQRAMAQPEKSEEYYRAALALELDFAPAWLALGEALAEKPEQGAAALETLEKYCALEPGDPRGHRALGKIRQQLNQLEEAAADFRRALALDPDDAEAHFRLAAVLARLGRADEAAAARQRFQELEQRRTDERMQGLAFTNALRDGQRLARQNLLAEAAAQFEQALTLRPGSDVALSMLAKVEHSRGNLAAARHHIEAAIAANPLNAEYRYVHGLILLALKEDSSAEGELALASRLAPFFGDAFNQLGHLAARRGDWPLAAQHYKAAVAAEPDDPAYHLNLAGAYQRLGRAGDAEKHRQRFRELTAAASKEKP